MSCGIVTEFLKINPIVSNTNVLEDVSTNYAGAGICVKQVLLERGQKVIQHKHKYPHLSILQHGQVTVYTDKWERKMIGPASVVIEANINHMVVAHTDAMWLCVHIGEPEIA